MNNLKDVSDFIDTIPLGAPIYKITNGYSDEIALRMQDWQAKKDLRNSDDWIKLQLSHLLQRKYDRINNKMVISNKEDAIDELKRSIADKVTKIVMKVSPADQPKRTNVYKELNDISYRNRKNDSFINDLIPVINYYSSHVESTESTNNQVHRKNVFGLLDILRKKYAKSSN